MVSPLGLGTVKLGRNRGVKYPSSFEIPDDARAADLLRKAQKLGVTLLDTAPAYGESEERIGRIIGSCGGRDRWTIVTKAGEEFDAATGESRFDFSAEAISASVSRSLKRLRANHVDVVLLHSDGRDEWLLNESGAVEALARLKKRGMTRAIGISVKSAEGAMAALGVPHVDVVMATLNAGDQSCLPAIRLASERGVGVLIKKALASGHGLAQHAAPEQALRLCLVEPGVSAVIVGTIDQAHLEENARAVERMLPIDARSG